MKRKHHVASISLVLLTVLLLPLLVRCAKQPQYATSAPVIPEGWEAVSTEGNVTHLQLKEGSDAYHWMDCGWQLGEANTNLPLDVHIAGNEAKKPISPDKDGNVYFIVYYGRFYAEKIDGKYQIVDAPEEDIRSQMTLHMESGGEDWIGNLSGTSLFPDPWVLDEFVEYNDVLFEPLEKVNRYDPEVRVGLKRAVLIACPYDKLDTGWETLIFRTEQRDGSSGDYSEEDYLSYATQNNTVYFSEEDLSADSIPLLTDIRVYLITSLVFLLCSFVIMLVSAMREKNCLLHFIPLLVGCLHSYAVYLYCRALPLPIDQWAHGVDLLAIIMGFVYLFFGILFLVIRWIIERIRRRMAKKAATRNAPEASSDPE